MRNIIRASAVGSAFYTLDEIRVEGSARVRTEDELVVLGDTTVDVTSLLESDGSSLP